MKQLHVLLVVCAGVSTIQGMHELYARWSESTPLIREYLLAVADNVPDQAIKEAEQKLLAHHTTMLGIALQPYYSRIAVQELQDTLTLQGMLMIKAINAAKKSDSKKFDEELNALRQNSTVLSTQLNKMNPYIDFCRLREMLCAYLHQFKIMVLERLSGKWSQDAQNYEKLRSHQQALAHYIVQAINNAFPPKEFISIQKK